MSNSCCTGCCSCLLVVVLVHDMSLQLVRLEKSQGLHCSMNSILQIVDSLRPDELIWLHAYMTGRVHALMPATHLQMSGRPMGTQSRVPEAAASVSSEQSAPPRGLGMAYLTPTCGATCSTCGRRACQVTTPHDDHVCFACEQQALRQQQRLVESESESCG